MPSTPKAAVVVLYHHPHDASAFERYYDETHVPLVRKHAPELGIERVELTTLAGLDGSQTPYYRKAELWFASEDAMRRGMAMPAFGVLAGDLGVFSTGGVTVVTSVETHA